MKTTDFIDQDSLRTDIPEFGPGDELKVHVRVVEGGKERPRFFKATSSRSVAVAFKRPIPFAS